MELIPFLDYFLEQANIPMGKAGSVNMQITHEFYKCLDYAKFLKLELALWMFVPCDKEGNVLKKPKGYDIYTNWEVLNPKFEQFKEAKDGVIFDGFELVEFGFDEFEVQQIELIDSGAKCTAITFVNKKANGVETIEDLTSLGLTIKETAIKEHNL